MELLKGTTSAVMVIINKFSSILNKLAEGQAWCSGESYLTESPGRRFEAASLQILRGKACLGFSLPQTPLMWEPPALGLPILSSTT